VLVGTCTAGYYFWNLETVPITSILNIFLLKDRKRFSGFSLSEKQNISRESFSEFYKANRHLILPSYSNVSANRNFRSMRLLRKLPSVSVMPPLICLQIHHMIQKFSF
jgi:hypothetical protein